jgi:hypothetical protein
LERIDLSQRFVGLFKDAALTQWENVSRIVEEANILESSAKKISDYWTVTMMSFVVR